MSSQILKVSNGSDPRPWEIPTSWTWEVMGKVSEVVGGGTPRTNEPANYLEGDIPWITPADLSGFRNKYISYGAKSITLRGLTSSSARLLPSGTVLFSSRAPIGYIAIAAQPVSTNQGFKSFVLTKSLDSSYVYYYLWRARDLAKSMASGTTFPELSGKKAAEIPIPIPPLAEQRRIVAEVETQFARLDAAEAALERARAKLAFHRELIFRKLLSGDDIETPFAAHGLLELQNVTPMGWTWTTLDEIAEVRGGLAKGSKRAPLTPTRQVPYLRVANVQRGWLDLEEIKLIDATEADIATLRLVNGDVLFNEGGDRDKLGRGWVWEGQMPEVIHQNHVFRARLRPDTMIPRFLSLFVNTFGQSFFMSVGKQTTNLASVSLSNLRRLPIPVPDLVTQQSILEKVDQYASTQEQLYTTINAGLHKSETIRQSILQRAFSGQLVPQDLAEEPASVLLERIAAERASTAPPRRKAGTRRTKATSVEVQRGLL